MRCAYNTDTPHFIALCFIALLRYCFFYKLKVGANPASSKSIGALLPAVLAHFVSLCCTVVILTIFLTSFYVCYSDLSSVIFDVTLGKRINLADSSGDG